MEWIQLLSLFLANGGLILWMRAESRADWRHMDNKLDANIKAIHPFDEVETHPFRGGRKPRSFCVCFNS